MIWICTTDKLPEERQATLILCGDEMYVSTFCAGKPWENNPVPYEWRGPGPFRFFGHEVKWWAPLPAGPGS